MRYLSILLVLMVTVLAMLPVIVAADPPSQHGNACDDSDEINGWAFVISGKGNGVYSIDFVSESGDIPITNWDLRTVHDTAELGSPISAFSAMINNPTFSGVYTPLVACDHSRSAYSDSPPIYALPSAHIGTVTFTVDPGAAQDGSDDFYWDTTQGGAGHQTEGLLSAAVLAANGHLIVWCGDAGKPDGCPTDPNKTEPGKCGCGVADTDTDGDNTPDCNDIEECDGLDNDGDDLTDEGFDSDNDGTADCFDSEECDGLDNDGDGQIDEGVKFLFFRDADSDGFGSVSSGTAAACSAPAGYVASDDDCNDTDGSIYPGATEVCGDGIDQDCNGSDLACPPNPNDVDDDLDGFTENQGDCDDNDDTIHPGAAEVCGDGIDQDCDGSDLACPPDPNDVDDDLDGFTENQGDCNDTDDSVYPSAPEVCNGVDDDCDGLVDEGVKSTFYRDADDDGYGDPSDSTQACSQPSGYVTDNTDCNDASASVNPDMTEILCNGIDDDCSPATLDSPPDADGDGVTVCNGDCNDSDNTVYPGATEICNGVDDDCDAETDEGGVCDPIDADADGYPANVDCNDNDPTINPAAQEVCDGVDNDCDAKTDEDGVCPIDRDGDGIADNQDNCPNTSNPDQLDTDGDGIGDACDRCPGDPENQCGGGSIPGMTAWGALAGVMALTAFAVLMLKRKQTHTAR